MSDYRLHLAIQFAERLTDTGIEQARAIRLAAAAHDVPQDELLCAWIARLIARAEGRR